MAAAFLFGFSESLKASQPALNRHNVAANWDQQQI